LEVVVVEGHDGVAKPLRYAVGIKPGEEVSGEGLVGAEIRREVPIVPAVVSAHRDFIAARRGACDTNRDRVRLATGASETNHLRPRVKVAESFREVRFLGAVEGRHVAGVDRLPNRCVDLRMTVAERVRADPHDRHVDVLLVVEVPYAAPLRLAEVRGPLV